MLLAIALMGWETTLRTDLWEGASTDVSTIGFAAILLISTGIGLIADALTRESVPFGWAAAIVVGVIGSTVGTALLGGWGPGFGGVFLLPALLGAILFVVLLELTLSAFAAKPSSS